MKTRYLTLLTTLAFLGFSVSAMAHPCNKWDDPEHKHCDGGAIVYTAELTVGAFVFNPGPSVEVTLDSKGGEFTSNQNLNMQREENSGLEATWNDVFNTCVELLAQDSVVSFSVGSNDWSIQKAGGVRIVFYDVHIPDAPYAEVTVQLIGNEYNFMGPGQLYPPEPGSSSVFILDQAAIHGSTVKGFHPRSGCQPHGSGSFDIFELGYFDGDNFIAVPSTLTITATQQ